MAQAGSGALQLSGDITSMATEQPASSENTAVTVRFEPSETRSLRVKLAGIALRAKVSLAPVVLIVSVPVAGGLLTINVPVIEKKFVAGTQVPGEAVRARLHSPGRQVDGATKSVVFVQAGFCLLYTSPSPRD